MTTGIPTGVDLSKILGGQTQILGGKGGKKLIMHGHSSILVWRAPELSLKVYQYTLNKIRN